MWYFLLLPRNELNFENHGYFFFLGYSSFFNTVSEWADASTNEFVLLSLVSRIVVQGNFRTHFSLFRLRRTRVVCGNVTNFHVTIVTCLKPVEHDTVMKVTMMLAPRANLRQSYTADCDALISSDTEETFLSIAFSSSVSP